MLLIIGVQGEIVGITRLIKYLFLACQNGALREPPDIEWRSHYYGPYWDGINGAIGSLVERNLVSTTELKNDMGRTTRLFHNRQGQAALRQAGGKTGQERSFQAYCHRARAPAQATYRLSGLHLREISRIQGVRYNRRQDTLLGSSHDADHYQHEPDYKKHHPVWKQLFFVLARFFRYFFQVTAIILYRER